MNPREKYYWEKPYVCVTGITTPAEAEAVISEFQKAGYSVQGSGHMPAIGFLASYKTINKIENKNKRYPTHETLLELLEEADSRILKAVHYNTRELDDLDKQVFKALRGSYCDLLQLNIAWPNPAKVRVIKEKIPHTGIILQVSSKAIQGLSAKEIAKKVLSYHGISHVLIDPSGGRGADFDIEQSLAIYFEIKENRPFLDIGFAGGLYGGTVKKITKTLAERIGSTDFSIDAEGKLRDKISDEFFGNDILNIDKVKAYLQNARKTLK